MKPLPQIEAVESRRFLWMAAWVLVIGVAIGLRFVDLDRKPYHADEANQSFKFGQLLAEGNYQYDPVDHHGPTLYYLTLPLAWAVGAQDMKELDENLLRILPAVFGVGVLLILLLFRRGFSSLGLLLAALLIAVNPAMVYYSRYFTQEMLLVFFTFGFLGAVWRYLQAPSFLWAILIGVFLGLMHATKETFVIHVAGAALALPFAAPRIPWKSGFKHLPIVLFIATGVSILFFSSFFTHWDGVRDSVMTYYEMANRAVDEGHGKPWWYYIALLGWQDNPGLLLTEVLLLVLAIMGAGVALQKQGVGAYLLIYTLFVGVVYSLIPYKTPWLVVNLIPGLALLGACNLQKDGGSRLRYLLLLPIAFGVAHLVSQTQKSTFVFHSDSRNPYTYSQTSTDLARWMENKLEPISKKHDKLQIRVIHENYWPLPWTLRNYDVKWNEVIPHRPDADLILVAAELSDELETQLMGDYASSFMGFRPNELLVAYIRSDLWVELVDPTSLQPEQGPFPGRAMSSVWQIYMAHTNEIYSAGAASAAYEELDRIEGLLSTYIGESDISRINRGKKGEQLLVAPETMDCLLMSEKMRVQTAGAFDIAFAHTNLTPTVELNQSNLTVTVLVDEPQLDLGGIGKGFALDRMAKLLTEDFEISDLLLDATSTALAVGDRAWPIGVGGRRLALQGRAISASGLAVKGKHIVDPRTGTPVDRDRVWVTAPSGAEADALSTAVLVLGQEQTSLISTNWPNLNIVWPQPNPTP